MVNVMLECVFCRFCLEKYKDREIIEDLFLDLIQKIWKVKICIKLLNIILVFKVVIIIKLELQIICFDISYFRFMLRFIFMEKVFVVLCL